MKIIRYNQLDSQKVTALWNDAFSDYSIPIQMTEEGLNNRLKNFDLSPNDSLVAVSDDNQPIGILLIGYKVFNNQHIAWVGGMGVIPAFRKQGVAQKLLAKMEQEAKARGVAQIKFEVIKSNDRARELYLGLDYRPLTTLGFYQAPLAKLTEQTLVFCPSQAVTEPDTTPWQNRFAFCSIIEKISDKGETIGVIGYQESLVNETVQGIVIRQLHLDKIDNLASVISALYERYGAISCSWSNVDVETPLAIELSRLNVTKELVQLQLIKEL